MESENLTIVVTDSTGTEVDSMEIVVDAGVKIDVKSGNE